MTRERLATLVLTVVSGVCLAGQAAAGTAEDDAARVRARVAAFAAAFRDADVPALDSLLAPGYVHTNSGGTPIRRTEWLAYIASRRKALASGELRLSRYENQEVVVTLNDATAIVTGVNVSEGVDRGKRFSRRLRFTQVWAKTEAGWQRLAFHDAEARP